MEPAGGCGDMTVKLLSGCHMPMIGLGTHQINGAQLMRDVVNRALAAGYRCFDTAAAYGNERELGSALADLLPKHGLRREDIFVTSKLLPGERGDEVPGLLRRSLDLLGLRYLDLYLIHWPGVHGLSIDSRENAAVRLETWRQLVKQKADGAVRAIGVSNYTARHLEELLQCSDVRPDVNQVEWHPHHHQPELLALSRGAGVVLQAYSSLGGSGNRSLLGDAQVQQVARRHGRSPAQVLLRWAVQQGVAVIPKARSEQHLVQNLQLGFELTADDMAALSADRVARKYAWDPSRVL